MRPNSLEERMVSLIAFHNFWLPFPWLYPTAYVGAICPLLCHCELGLRKPMQDIPLAADLWWVIAGLYLWPWVLMFSQQIDKRRIQKCPKFCCIPDGEKKEAKYVVYLTDSFSFRLNQQREKNKQFYMCWRLAFKTTLHSACKVNQPRNKYFFLSIIFLLQDFACFISFGLSCHSQWDSV